MQFIRRCLTLSLLIGLGTSALAAAEKDNPKIGRAGNWRKAAQGSPDLNSCAKIAKEEPNNPEAQNDYGWALRQHGDLLDAELYLKKAEALDPSLSYVHCNLSVVFFDQGKSDKALAEAKKAVDADGQQPLYRAVYGNALLASGDTKAAIEQYNTAIKLRPDYENAYYHLGCAYQKDGQNTEAKAALSEALKLDPEDERVMKLLDQLMN